MRSRVVDRVGNPARKMPQQHARLPWVASSLARTSGVLNPCWMAAFYLVEGEDLVGSPQSDALCFASSERFRVLALMPRRM